jgi:hypothetical protein
MENYNNYSNESLRDYIINTRKSAQHFDRTGSHATATIHYNEATRAEYVLISRIAK